MHDQEWKDREERAISDRSNFSPAMIAWAVAAVLAVVFILQNRTDTEIGVLFWNFQTSVWVAILIAMVLGALLGWLGVKLLRRRRQ